MEVHCNIPQCLSGYRHVKQDAGKEYTRVHTVLTSHGGIFPIIFSLCLWNRVRFKSLVNISASLLVVLIGPSSIIAILSNHVK